MLPEALAGGGSLSDDPRPRLLVSRSEPLSERQLNSAAIATSGMVNLPKPGDASVICALVCAMHTACFSRGVVGIRAPTHMLLSSNASGCDERVT